MGKNWLRLAVSLNRREKGMFHVKMLLQIAPKVHIYCFVCHGCDVLLFKKRLHFAFISVSPHMRLIGLAGKALHPFNPTHIRCSGRQQHRTKISAVCGVNYCTNIGISLV